VTAVAEIIPNLAAQADVPGVPDEPVAAPAPVVAPAAPSAPPAASGARALRAEFGLPDAAPPAAASRVNDLRKEFGLTPTAKPAPHAVAKPAVTAPPAEQNWGDTLTSAVRNAVPSTGALFTGMAHAVLNPSETLGNIEQLGKGVASKAAGALGVTQNQAEKAKSEALVDALVDHYKHDYGSVAGFKQKLASDPAGVALDASTVLGGGGVLLKGAGLADAAGVAARASSLVDPIANAGRVAKSVAPVVTTPLRVLGTTSGASKYLQKVATAAGATADPELRATYNTWASGQGNEAEFQQRLGAAADKARAAASADFMAKRSALGNNPVDLQGVADHLDAEDAALQKGAQAGWNPNVGEAQQRVRDMVNSVALDPAKQGLDHVDALKRQLDDYGSSLPPRSVAQNYVFGARSKVRSALSDPARGGDPAYADLMDAYQVDRNNTNNITKTLGARSKMAASTAIKKSQAATKTPGGQTMLDELAAYDPHLPYMVAGRAANPAMKGWLSAAGDAAAGATTAAMMGLNPLVGLPAILASSPRIVMGLNKAAGTASRVAGNVPARGLAYAGKLDAVAPAAKTAATPNANDIDAATRMAIAEAGGEPAEGQAAVVHSAINRSRLSGASVAAEIAKPGSYEAVGNGSAARVDAQSPAYQHVRDTVVVPALTGALADPTGGATHYLNPTLQASLGRPQPSWAQGEPKAVIGHHAFYAPTTEGRADGGRVARADGGRIGGAAHEKLVARLMALAVSAKHESNKATEPLLQQPDEHIVKALDVAQRAI
jgi:hypothetical protein